MYEDEYGVIKDDEVEEPAVDELDGAEEPEEATPVEPVLDEPAPPGKVVYTRGPGGRLIPI